MAMYLRQQTNTSKCLEAGVDHSVFVDARQVLKRYKMCDNSPKTCVQPWKSIKRQLERAQQVQRLESKRIHVVYEK